MICDVVLMMLQRLEIITPTGTGEYQKPYRLPLAVGLFPFPGAVIRCVINPFPANPSEAVTNRVMGISLTH